MKTSFKSLGIGEYFELKAKLPMVPFTIWKKISDDMAVARDAEGCSMAVYQDIEVLHIHIVH